MRTATRVLRAGPPRRGQGNQQHQQGFRSTSVIAALLRLRSQYQRSGGSHNSSNLSSTLSSSTSLASGSSAAADVVETLARRGNSGSSAPQDDLTTEALRLLNKKARASDPLSDFSESSPSYCVEVGKVLSVGATFAVPTTAGRIQDALAWTERNTASLKTPKQIMSLSMPLLSLQDGGTHGRQFVVQHLLEPLLDCLQETKREDDTTALSIGNAEQRSAIASVYPLITKMMSEGETEGGINEEEEKKLAERLVLLLEVTTERLLTTYGRGTQGSPASRAFTVETTPLEPFECTNGLEAVRIAWHHPRVMASPALSARVSAVLTALLPVLDATVSAQGWSAAAATTPRRVQDSVRLMDAILSLLAGRGLSSSTAAAHGRMTADQQGALQNLLRAVLAALPASVSTASPRDLCALVQAVNRIRSSSSSSAVAVAVDLAALMHAIRPQVFLLTEQHGGSSSSTTTTSSGGSHSLMRQAECSQLISGLSRWEWLPAQTASAAPAAAPSSQGVNTVNADGLTAPVPDDMLSLLCDQFTRKMSYVLAGHLVPFLQGLARMEAFRQAQRRPRGTTAAAKKGKDTNAILMSSVEAVSLSVEASCTRAVKLVNEGKLSVTDAANILAAFAQLRAVSESITWFAVVEDQLASTLEEETFWTKQKPMTGTGSKGGVASDHDSGQASHDLQQARAAVLRALEPFEQLVAPVVATEEDAVVARRALALRQRLHGEALGSVDGLRTPKELITFFSDLHHAKEDTLTDAAVGVMSPSLTAAGVFPGGIQAGASTPDEEEGTVAPLSEFPTLAFLRKVREQAPFCNGYELASLAWAVARLRRGLQAAKGDAGAQDVDQRRPHQSHEGRQTNAVAPTRTMEAQVSTHHDSVIGETLEGTLGALSGRALQVCASMSVADIKKLMDALRMARYLDGAETDRPHHRQQDDDRERLAETLCAAMETAIRRSRGEGVDVPRALQENIALGKTLSSFLNTREEAAGLSPQASTGLLAAFAAHATPVVRRTIPLLTDLVQNPQSPPVVEEGKRAAEPGGGGLTSGAKNETAKALVEQLVVLAYVTAQLCGATLVKERVPGRPHPVPAQAQRRSSPPVPSAVTEDAVEEDHVEGDSAGTADEEEGAVNGGVEDTESVRIAEDAVRELLDAIAESVLAALESARGPKLAMAAMPHEGDTAAASSVLTAKELIMLVQSFESANVPLSAPRDLLFSLLPRLRDLATGMDPLEVSLLMNAMARLGVWNAQAMKRPALEVIDRVSHECSVRQCCSMLRGMQRSGSLPTSAFLWPKRRSGDGAARDGSTGRGDVGRWESHEDALLSLSRAAVDRLDSFVLESGRLKQTLDENTLEDLLSAVQVLSSFDVPPQPTFGSYHMLATKKLLLELKPRQLSGHSETIRKAILSATLLASRVHHLCSSEHQRVVSAVLMDYLSRIERESARAPAGSSPLGAEPNAVFERAFASMGLGKMAEFHQVCRTHLLFYDSNVEGHRVYRELPSALPEDPPRSVRVGLLRADVSVFFQQLSRSALHAAAGPLHQFWQVLAPLPTVSRDDALVGAKAAQHLVSFVDAQQGGENGKHLSLRTLVLLVESLTRCLCSGACRREAPTFVARAHEQLHELLALAHTQAETTAMTPSQAATLLLGQAMAAPGSPAKSDRDTGLTEMVCATLQSRPLLLQNAVDATLAFAILQTRQGGSQMLPPGTNSETAAPEVFAAWAHACRSLVPRLGEPSAVGVRTLPHVYRLLMAHDSVCLKACVGLQTQSSSSAEAELSTLMWDVLLRALVVMARTESLGAGARAAIAHRVLGDRALKRLAKSCTMAREVRSIAKTLGRRRRRT